MSLSVFKINWLELKETYWRGTRPWMYLTSICYPAGSPTVLPSKEGPGFTRVKQLERLCINLLS